MNYPQLTDPIGLRGKQLDRHLLHNQRKWIEWCEGNERSYTGPNGPSIRQADHDELRRLEQRVQEGRHE